VIDCDVHQSTTSIKDLLPYLPQVYREQILHAGYGGIDFPQYPWTHPEGFWRRDAFPDDGRPAGSDYELLRRQLLDPYGVEYALLTGEDILTASCMASPHLAGALCRAYNDWVVETWLPRDSRLKASVAVATQDPEEAAREIRRVGGHPDLVQVLLPTGSRVGYGHRQFDPIFDAAAELALVVAIHIGGDGVGVMGAPTATGWPVHYIEYHTLFSTSMMSHLVSLICHGTFEKFPTLRVVLIESGVCWLPGLVWRLDNDYRGLRMEVPWVKRLPSEYVREHVRLTTQPLERPDSLRDLRAMLELIGPEMLLFATDYPHWDFDNPEFLPVPPEWAERVFERNAREWYGLPARAPEPALPAPAGA
jgi:uncharacterized protein